MTNRFRDGRVCKLAKDLGPEFRELRPYLGSTAVRLEKAYACGEKILLEGTQGTGLSIFHGDYPSVTSRDTTVSGCLSEAGIGPRRVNRIVLVCRTYPHHEVGAFMPDFNGSIRHFEGDNGLFTTEESARRHAAHRAFIERELARAEAERMETVVVITHHAPSPICVRPWYHDSKVNGAFASNLDDLIERYRPRLWIHGHMHDPVDERIGATRIIANPHGFSLTEGADFEPSLIVTV